MDKMGSERAATFNMKVGDGGCYLVLSYRKRKKRSSEGKEPSNSNEAEEGSLIRLSPSNGIFSSSEKEESIRGLHIQWNP